jgi:hypothetical protein
LPRVLWSAACSSRFIAGAAEQLFVAAFTGGDGDDQVFGQSGNPRDDSVLFEGSDGIDTAEVNSSTRDLAMDFNGVEHIQLTPWGSADKITVNNLTGTDAKQVDVDLAATAGSTQGDGQPDQMTVNGTQGNDQINVFRLVSKVIVTRLPAQVSAAR